MGGTPLTRPESEQGSEFGPRTRVSARALAALTRILTFGLGLGPARFVASCDPPNGPLVVCTCASRPRALPSRRLGGHARPRARADPEASRARARARNLRRTRAARHGEIAARRAVFAGWGEPAERETHACAVCLLGG